MFGRRKNKEPESKKIGMISLGCPKNQVDAELMLEKLAEAGYEIRDDVAGCDAVLVNTCGFIEAAKKEAIENILYVAGYKEDGEVGKLVVTGCLSERYQRQIMDEMPEVDAVVGLGGDADIVSVMERVFQGEKVLEFPDKEELPLEGDRILTTPNYYAYVKIGEGCSNNCAFCAIPEIRGRFRSRPMESIIGEVRALVKKGVKEVILIAQDTSLYGKDLYGKLKLPELLRELCKVEGLHWIRFLYCYPERITDELLEVMATEPKVCHYFDIPLQHADGACLKRMNRVGDREHFEALIAKIRERIPDCCIRTTVMTGFPGETEEELESMTIWAVLPSLRRRGLWPRKCRTRWTTTSSSTVRNSSWSSSTTLRSRRTRSVLAASWKSLWTATINTGTSLSAALTGACRKLTALSSSPARTMSPSVTLSRWTSSALRSTT